MDPLLQELAARNITLTRLALVVGISRANVSLQLHGHRPLQARVRIAAERLIADAERAQALDVANRLIAAGDLDGAAQVLDHAGLALGQDKSAEGPATAGPST